MVLRPADVDREYDKFTTDSNGDTAVRTVGESTVTGEIQITGLGLAIRTTTMLVGTTPVKLPAAPLADRNSVQVLNLDDNEILYIGNSDVTADRVVGTTSGFEVGPGNSFQSDIRGTIEIYGVVASGSIMVKVTEVA